MPDTPTAHVGLDRHPQHPDAVTATVTGPRAATARAILSGYLFRPADGRMVLARIDHEEHHHADRAARALRQAGISVEITPGLQEDIGTEWTWANYPMPWLTRDEVREVGVEAQKIHDDIAPGHLVIHAHADDGHTTVAIGTYPGGKSIHLHGEDHLRQTAMVYDTPLEALAAFEDLYTSAVRPGPAPATDTEQRAARALTTTGALTDTPGPTTPEPPASTTETVPAHAADPGDHEALLGEFFEAQGEWEKYRTWDDDCTYAVHESQTLRIEFDHETHHRTDTTWTVAAYESPVSERLWHATATTPADIIRALLTSLASENAWGAGPDTRITEKTIAEATRPRADTGWTHTVDGHGITLTAPGPHPAGVRFDPLIDHPHPAWTLWSGNPEGPDWTIHLSTHTPPALLQDLTYELAHSEGVRQTPRLDPPKAAPGPSRPVVPSPPASVRKR